MSESDIFSPTVEEICTSIIQGTPKVQKGTRNQQESEEMCKRDTRLKYAGIAFILDFLYVCLAFFSFVLLPDTKLRKNICQQIVVRYLAGDLTKEMQRLANVHGKEIARDAVIDTRDHPV